MANITTLGTAVIEDFDTLANTATSSTLPDGWAIAEAGSNANTSYAAGTGSSNSGNSYSFGADGSTERALGGLQSGSLIPTFGSSFTNTSGDTITSLDIAFTGEQWRRGDTARTTADRIDFQISFDATSLTTGTWVDVNELDFSSLIISGIASALDGNATANRAAVSSSITGLNIADGATFWIRFTDFNASGSDDGLAIDDFSLTAQGAPPPPSLTIQINDATIDEGDTFPGTASLTVGLSAPAGPGGVTFDIATTDGTATAGVDYTARALTSVVIPEGQQYYVFEVEFFGDAEVEADETILVNITNVVGATVADAQGSITINNDDVAVTPGAFSINDASISEGNSGTTNLTFTVTRSGGSDGEVTVTYDTLGGTASGGGDYTEASGSLVFADGETTKTITVEILGDTEVEADETFAVLLNTATNGGTFTDSEGTGTIVNDDASGPAPTVIFSADFNDFRGLGFAPSPTAGQLDSDVYVVTGLSDGSGTFGGTHTTGDFARGIATAGVSTGGIYALNQAGDYAFWVQPGADDFTPGALVIAIVNTGDTTDTFSIDYDLLLRNDQGRSNSFNLEVSNDGTTWTAVSALAFTSPVASDALGVTSTDSSGAFTLGSAVGTGETFYVRFLGDDVGGSGSRDEFGIDNLTVSGVVLPPNPNGRLSIADVAQAEGNSGVTNFEFTVTRAGGSTGEVSASWALANGTTDAGDFAGSTSGTVTFADGETSKTITVQVAGDAIQEANETFTVTLTDPTGGAEISDGTATGTIQNEDVSLTAIYTIQGSGQTSALVGQSVTTSGIVTAVDSNGYYLQDAMGDGNSATSDGIFIFTNSAPSVVVGDAVTVTGTVSEFTPGGNSSGNLSTTQVTQSSAVVTSTGNALPTAVVLGVDRLAPTESIADGITFYESLEGMLVTINQPVAVASTSGFGEIYTVVNDGVGATGLSDRGAMTITPIGGNLTQTDVGAGSDYNPEIIQIDGDAFTPGGATSIPNVTTGTQLNSVTGVVSYSFGQYEVLATSAVTVETESTITRETAAFTGNAGQLTVATYNVHNLDPSDGQAQFDQLGRDIGFNLGAPDIIGLQEVQDNNGATNDGVVSASVTLQTLADAILAQTGVQYNWIDNTFITDDNNGGEPGGNIRVAFLYRADRVDLVEGSVRPVTDSAFDGARIPLAATFSFLGNEITVVSNHFTSKGGSTDLLGATQPSTNGGAAQRLGQAEAVAAFVATEDDLVDGVIVLGDLNEFQNEDSLAPLVGAGLTNLNSLLDADERYSYNFEGNAQSLDHIYATGNLVSIAQFDAVHINSEFAEADQASDHDPLVAAFTFVDTSPEVRTNGTKNNDTINGADNVRDTILGRNGDDTIYGFGSDDTLIGGNGADVLYGGKGNDELRGGHDADRLYGDAGNDVIYGEAGVDTIEGGIGNDTIDAGTEDDFVYGNEGDDTLFGQKGNDQLFGGTGEDILRGGAGNDTLEGGADADIFAFERSFGSDTITDFEDGVDTISFVTSVFANYAKLSAAMVQDGDDVLISTRGNVLRIEDVLLANLTADDFLFV